jgi:TP53 regulating kinase-like protein
MAAVSPELQSQFSPPKILTYPASTPGLLIAQGAEGRLYKTSFLTSDTPCALKFRPSKPYRHPILDARLTKARILAEARVLNKCRRDGVSVPAVYCIDEAAGWLMMEWIDGIPVRVGINEWLGSRQDGNRNENQESRDDGEQVAMVNVMRRIGKAVGLLHRTGIIHGDLTTSNMMLKPRKSQDAGETAANSKDAVLDGDVIIIDFGLATQSSSDEDRAVDLYVLERAFASTHPRAEPWFAQLLEEYKGTFKQAGSVLRKLDDVRQRGRKRSMLG